MLILKPKDAMLIGCQWIYKLKDGSTNYDAPKYKARLVAKGFSQKEGLVYNDIFAVVVIC